MTKATKYYRLFVIVQAVALFAFLSLRDLAPRDRHKARLLRAYSDITGGLPTVLKMFKEDCGRYPTMEEGWNALIIAPTNGSLENWHGPYLDGAPEDPWGHEYVYRFPVVHGTNAYEIYSRGFSVPSSSTVERLIERSRDWLLFIPFFFLVGMIAQLILPSVREAAQENRCVDWLWFATALIALLVLITPRISGWR